MVNLFDANSWLQTDWNRMDPTKTAARFTFEKMLHSTDHEVWVFDGPYHNEPRRAIFDGYKRRDYTGREDILSHLKMMREILLYAGCVLIEVPNFEADDVIGTLAKRFAPCRVYSTDFDLHQLRQHPGVELIGVKAREDVPPAYVPLYKALRGDPSDKIPGVPGFGQKAWESLWEFWPEMDQAMRDRDGAYLLTLPLRPAIKAWLIDPNHQAEVLAFYKIATVWDVPIDLINEHTRYGAADPEAAHALLNRFML